MTCYIYQVGPLDTINERFDWIMWIYNNKSHKNRKQSTHNAKYRILCYEIALVR